MEDNSAKKTKRVIYIYYRYFSVVGIYIVGIHKMSNIAYIEEKVN